MEMVLMSTTNSEMVSRIYKKEQVSLDFLVQYNLAWKKEPKSQFTKMINLVITDDHKILRQGIIKLLKNLGDYNILAELNDGEELLRNFGTQKEKTDLFI